MKIIGYQSEEYGAILDALEECQACKDASPEAETCPSCLGSAKAPREWIVSTQIDVIASTPDQAVVMAAMALMNEAAKMDYMVVDGESHEEDVPGIHISADEIATSDGLTLSESLSAPSSVAVSLEEGRATVKGQFSDEQALAVQWLWGVVHDLVEAGIIPNGNDRENAVAALHKASESRLGDVVGKEEPEDDAQG